MPRADERPEQEVEDHAQGDFFEHYGREEFGTPSLRGLDRLGHDAPHECTDPDDEHVEETPEGIAEHVSPVHDSRSDPSSHQGERNSDQPLAGNQRPRPCLDLGQHATTVAIEAGTFPEAGASGSTCLRQPRANLALILGGRFVPCLQSRPVQDDLSAKRLRGKGPPNDVPDAVAVGLHDAMGLIGFGHRRNARSLGAAFNRDEGPNATSIVLEVAADSSARTLCSGWSTAEATTTYNALGQYPQGTKHPDTT